jgi:gliding motility-associated-like protein
LAARSNFLILYIICLILCIGEDTYSQEFGLVGILQNKLMRIDHQSGLATQYQIINNLDGNEDLVDLTYHEGKGLYFSILNPSNSPKLVSISIEGDYQVIGPITLNDNQIRLAESIAYNSSNNKLYLGVSLNGGTSSGDYYSESLVEVDPDTGGCIFISELSTSHLYPDIDVITFNNNVLYLFDGGPPSANFSTFYKIDFDDITEIFSPGIIYETTYIAVRDFSCNGQYVYFNDGSRLYYLDLTSGTIHFIGETHQPIEYDGKIIHGISELIDCKLPELEFLKDTTICSGESIELEITLPGAICMWQDGSNSSKYSISEPGQYWVNIENSCGSIRDSFEVIGIDKNKFSLGADTIICDNMPLVLNIKGFDGLVKWKDGTIDSTYLADHTDTYWAESENRCGVAIDSINVQFLALPTVNLGKDTVLCEGAHIDIDIGLGNFTYEWHNGNTNSFITIDGPGIYWVKIENYCGIAFDTLMVDMITIDNPLIPNVFTPNNDDINDFFEIDERLQGSTVHIYQRGGAKVFESKSYHNNWNGSNTPSATYYYLITDNCGNNYKGWVDILY